MATIKRKVDYNPIEQQLDVLDKVKRETMQNVAIFLRNRGIKFGYLPDFIKNPPIYIGNKETGMKEIFSKFLNDALSHHYREIQSVGLQLKYIYHILMKEMFNEANNDG